jgi:urea transport system permease protein
MMAVRSVLRVILTALVLSLCASATVLGQSANPAFEAALERLKADNFADTEAAIGVISASGVPQGVAILEAMAERRLFAGVSGVFYRDKAGQLFDAATGQRAIIATEPGMVRLNNRLRNLVQAAVGSLTLLSPDPAQRLRAAEAVFKSRDPAERNLAARQARSRRGPGCHHPVHGFRSGSRPYCRRPAYCGSRRQ